MQFNLFKIFVFLFIVLSIILCGSYCTPIIKSKIKLGQIVIMLETQFEPFRYHVIFLRNSILVYRLTKLLDRL